jgi:hypothetical protein
MLDMYCQKTDISKYPLQSLEQIFSSGKPKHRLERLQHLIWWFDDRRKEESVENKEVVVSAE